MKHGVQSTAAIIALAMLAGCDGSSLKKKKVQEQNQARGIIDAHFFLPDDRALASAQDGNGNGLRRTNAYQVWYKTLGRCEKVEDNTIVGAYAEGKRVTLQLIPSCSYNLTIALGWSDQLAGNNQINSATGTGNRIKPYATAALRLSADNPTYETEIKDVIARNCLGCHNAERSLGGVDISSFAKAQRAARGSLSAIQGGTMPRPDPAAMSAADKRLFTLWVEQGTAENEPIVDPDDGNNNDNNDNNNDNNDNNNSDNDTPERPQTGNNNANGGGGNNVIQTVFLQSALLEIRAEQLQGKDEVEIADIRLKPTADGQQAGFTSDVSTSAP